MTSSYSPHTTSFTILLVFLDDLHLKEKIVVCLLFLQIFLSISFRIAIKLYTSKIIPLDYSHFLFFFTRSSNLKLYTSCQFSSSSSLLLLLDAISAFQKIVSLLLLLFFISLQNSCSNNWRGTI